MALGYKSSNAGQLPTDYIHKPKAERGPGTNF